MLALLVRLINRFGDKRGSDEEYEIRTIGEWALTVSTLYRHEDQSADIALYKGYKCLWCKEIPYTSVP